MPMQRSEQALREAALNIAQYLPDDDDDARKICDLALQLRGWRDKGEPLEVPAPKLVDA